MRIAVIGSTVLIPTIMSFLGMTFYAKSRFADPPWSSVFAISLAWAFVIMNTDRILRLDPATGRAVEYLLPQQTNIRKVTVDNSTTPVTFWTGNNHHAAIIKLEPLE